MVDLLRRLPASPGDQAGDLSDPRALVRRLPLKPGVYRFRDAAGHALYVGRAVNLRRRAASYWGDLRDRPHLAPMVARIAYLEAVVCDSAHEAAWLERNLLERHKPPWNRSPSGGQEAEVWIRLSESARAPGVRVVYRRSPGEGARHFGPYLGGRKVRDAVSGLGRVLPLRYAADRPTGTERELARMRGASPAARDGLVRTVTAVLDRDPAAVAALRAELTARRDAAAAALAFEFAARLQAELEALDWITAEQKVTQAQPSDFDVYGWADGMLVRFEVRGGRMSGWSQRACGRAAARRYLDETMPRQAKEEARGTQEEAREPGQACCSAWADFARRSAELAARLSPQVGRWPFAR
jgi:excinuclease ABC subunit C